MEDTNADLASARRVAEFVEQRPVAYVLGAHIELDESGKTFVAHNDGPDGATTIDEARFAGLACQDHTAAQ